MTQVVGKMVDFRGVLRNSYCVIQRKFLSFADREHSYTGFLSASFLGLFISSLFFFYEDINLAIIFILFASVWSICYFTQGEIDHLNLVRVQIFYILPFLIYIIFNKDNDSYSEFLLFLMVFVLSGIICVQELLNTKKIKSYFSTIKIYDQLPLAIYLLCTAVLCYLFSFITKYLILLNVLMVYCIVPLPKSYLEKIKYHDKYKKLKIISYCIIMICFFCIPTNKIWGSILYIASIISIINLLFLFRDNKDILSALIGILVMLSIVFNVSEMHIDSLLLSIIVLLFHARSPVLYSASLGGSEMVVEYQYRCNKIILKTGGIVDLERYLDKDDVLNADISYYGSINNGHISELFKALHVINKGMNISCLGLNGGVLLAFADKKDKVFFYENDQVMIDVSKNKNLFNYLEKSQSKVTIVHGDIRKKFLASKVKNDLIFIETHEGGSLRKSLVTTEAIELFYRQLSSNGALIFHIKDGDNIVKGSLSRVIQNLGLNAISCVSSHSEEDHMYSGLFATGEKKRWSDKFARLFNKVGFMKNYVYHNNSSWVVLYKNADTFSKLSSSRIWHKQSLHKYDECYTDRSIGYDRGEIISDIE